MWIIGWGRGQKYQGELIQRSEQLVPPKWHHRGDGMGKFFQSETHICLNRYLPSALILSYVDPWLWRGAVGVRSSWSRVPPIQGQPPAYLAHTNPINLPILSWHRDYQHTWPLSWLLSDNLGKTTWTKFDEFSENFRKGEGVVYYPKNFVALFR